jgi:DNA modification methylase
MVEIGDCREILRRWIAEGVRVQTCVTSPPYWGLRDYGVEGQLGLEATPEQYVAGMVEVFRLVREVLADDGTLWLNLGDSYTGNAASGGANQNPGGHAFRVVGVPIKSGNGLKPKDLVGIPWRVAFALQADGWTLRSDIIWHKPNPMPESVTDRPTKAHEYVFLLAKSERYFYDAEAIKEPGEWCGMQLGIVRGKKTRALAMGRMPSGNERPGADADSPDRRNRRTVWTIATEPYSEAHFATFPQALVEPCILAGSRAGDTVLDPFMGSGTVARVAERFGRRWLGCELNPAYVDLCDERTKVTAGLAL